MNSRKLVQIALFVFGLAVLFDLSDVFEVDYINYPVAFLSVVFHLGVVGIIFFQAVRFHSQPQAQEEKDHSLLILAIFSKFIFDFVNDGYTAPLMNFVGLEFFPSFGPFHSSYLTGIALIILLFASFRMRNVIKIAAGYIGTLIFLSIALLSLMILQRAFNGENWKQSTSDVIDTTNRCLFFKLAEGRDRCYLEETSKIEGCINISSSEMRSECRKRIREELGLRPSRHNCLSWYSDNIMEREQCIGLLPIATRALDDPALCLELRDDGEVVSCLKLAVKNQQQCEGHLMQPYKPICYGIAELATPESEGGATCESFTRDRDVATCHGQWMAIDQPSGVDCTRADFVRGIVCESRKIKNLSVCDRPNNTELKDWCIQDLVRILSKKPAEPTGDWLKEYALACQKIVFTDDRYRCMDAIKDQERFTLCPKIENVWLKNECIGAGRSTGD
ncbi:MAG: hypothetical protein WAT81_04180 [Candidatus Moraniibacteriota bacterium]